MDRPAEYDEDDSDSDEEYNLKNFGIHQALPVDGEPDWSLAEPDTAEEYLRRVRYETARCPKVVRVEYDEESSPDPTTTSAAAAGGSGISSHSSSRGRRAVLPEVECIAEGPDWAKPNKDWVVQFVGDFQQLRREVMERYETGEYAADVVPHMNDVQAWDRLCFGAAAEHEAHASGVAAAAANGAGAELTCMNDGIFANLMALDQVSVSDLLQHHITQLLEVHPQSLPLIRAQWLFALAARLEKPLHPDLSAGFRALLRHCSKLRSGLQRQEDPLLPQLNVLIVVAGAYFGQDEQLCKMVDSSDLM